MSDTPTKPKKPLVCSICDRPIVPNWHGWAGGNNAEPINDGRCCDECDSLYVIPERIRRIYRDPTRDPKEK
jgi:hypothetical protein